MFKIVQLKPADVNCEHATCICVKWEFIPTTASSTARTFFTCKWYICFGRLICLFFNNVWCWNLKMCLRPRNTEIHEDDCRRHCQNGRSTGGFSKCGLRDTLRRHGQLPVPTRPGISGSRQCYRSDHYTNWTIFISLFFPTGWLGLMIKGPLGWQ